VFWWFGGQLAWVGNSLVKYVNVFHHNTTSHSGQIFSIGPCRLSIPLRTVKLIQDEPVYVQCVITEEPDPHIYAQASSFPDDAARSIIRIRGTTSIKLNLTVQFRRMARKNVKVSNTLFDLLVGRSFEESRALRNRWYTMRNDGKKILVYT